MSERLPPGTHRRELVIADQPREYLVHIPPGLNQPRPAVLLLHGTGGTAKWAMEETDFHRCADRHHFVAVFPQALPPDPNSPLKFIANPAVWNAGSTLFPGHTPDDIAYFDALFEDLTQCANIDPARIAVTGFSNGASMAFELAAVRGERLAAIVPIAGYCRVSQPPNRPVPTLFIIGAADPLVPLDGGVTTSPWTQETLVRPPARQGLDEWAAKLGNDTVALTVDVHNGVRTEVYAGPTPCHMMIVEGLGHHWPGGRGQLKKKLAGEPSHRLPANEVVWEFVRHYRI